MLMHICMDVQAPMCRHTWANAHTHTHVYAPACEYVIVSVNTLGMPRLVCEFLGVSSNPDPHSPIMFMSLG